MLLKETTTTALNYLIVAGRYISCPVDFTYDLKHVTNNDFENAKDLKVLVANVRALAASTHNLYKFPDNAYQRMLRNGKGKRIAQLLHECFPYTYICDQEEIITLNKLVGISEFKGSALSREDLNQDICLIGGRGVGKTHLINGLLSEKVTTIACYKDMTCRDMIAQRSTLDDGSSYWTPSPLVKSAQSGQHVVLDGIHRLQPDTLASLQQLLFARELTLPTGDKIKVHPDFKVVALAEAPTAENQWLVPETVQLFKFHQHQLVGLEDAALIVSSSSGVSIEDATRLMLHLINQNIALTFLNTTENTPLELNLRQVIRIANSLESGDESFESILNRILLLPFLSRSIQDAHIVQSFSFHDKKSLVRKSTTVHRSSSDVTLIPKVDNFVDMHHQRSHMTKVSKDLKNGNHVLLIGNQGTGKNKLIDRLLQESEMERLYMQLSRDSTVQNITFASTLVAGRIEYIKSPLVEALEKGLIVMIDEADKATKEVTVILKALLNDNKLQLSDGRMMVAHPEFRCICLANRPGFPFLGNDFFNELGDCFSPHIIDNGSVEDQIAVIKHFCNDDVNSDFVSRIANSFHTLRLNADDGVLKYPYSTREAIHVAKHLSMFPNDGLRNALDNVFAFDRTDKDSMELIHRAFAANGILVGKQDSAVVVNLATETDYSPSVAEDEIDMNEMYGGPFAPLQGGRNVSFLLEKLDVDNSFGKERKIGQISEFTEEILRFHYSAEKQIGAVPTSVKCFDNVTAVLAGSNVCLTTGTCTSLLDIDRVVGSGAIDLSIEFLGKKNFIIVCHKTGRVWDILENNQVFLYSLPHCNNKKAQTVKESEFKRVQKLVYQHLESGDQFVISKKNSAIGYGGRLDVKLPSRFHIRVEGKRTVCVFDQSRMKQQTFTFDSDVVDAYLFERDDSNLLATLHKDGMVSIREIDRSRTQKALEEWLELFSQQDNAFIELEMPSSSITNIVSGERVSSPGSGSGIGSGSGAGGDGPPVDSNGWGGYSSDKIKQLLNFDPDKRLELDLPIGASESSVSFSKETKELTFYEQAVQKVSRQIKELKLVLESAQAKDKERQWISAKPSGEFDENRLIESYCGEELVFRKRGEPDQLFGFFQKRPKRLLFLLDTSASMARANDDRLNNLIYSVTMLMESLDSFRSKFEYSLVCHSGSSSFLRLKAYNEWPTIEQRGNVCSQLMLNARSAVTGDNTLQAAILGSQDVVREEADEYLMVLISDANLGRYDISPGELGDALTRDQKVNSHAIFIAEPSAGEWLQKQLPLGKGHLCLNPVELPKVLAAIIAES